MSKSKRIILTSSGGSGHKSAARLMQQDAAAKNQNHITVDVVTGASEQVKFDSDGAMTAKCHKSELGWLRILGKDFGPGGIKRWNDAQQKSDLNELKTLLAKRKITEFTMGSSFYKETRKLLTENPSVEEVVTTQALSIDRVLQAVSDINKCNQRKVKLRIVLTDLPTKKAEHFFLTMRKIDLSKWGNVDIVIDSPYPIIDRRLSGKEREKAASDAFSELTPNLYQDDGTLDNRVSINFGLGPITKEFRDIYNEKLSPSYQESSGEVTLDLKFSKSAENDVASNLMKNEWVGGCKKFKESSAVKREIIIPKDAHVTSIMYGSQASHDGTLQTIDDERKLYAMKKNKDLRPHYTFVFCGKDVASESGEKSLYQQVLEIAKKENSEFFKIIPLTYQDHDMISRLYSRADTLAIRGGGLSIMEVEAVAKKESDIIVFSDVPKQCTLDQVKVLKNPVYWEEGNAEHLQNQFTTAVCANKFTYLQQRQNQMKMKDLRIYLENLFSLSGEALDRYLCKFDLSLVTDHGSLRYDLSKVFPCEQQLIKFLVLYKLLDDYQGNEDVIALVQDVKSALFNQAFNLSSFPDDQGFSELCESACSDMQKWNPTLVEHYYSLTKFDEKNEFVNSNGFLILFPVVGAIVAAALSAVLAAVFLGATAPLLLAISSFIFQTTGLSLAINLMLATGLTVIMSGFALSQALHTEHSTCKATEVVEKPETTSSSESSQEAQTIFTVTEQAWKKKLTADASYDFRDGIFSSKRRPILNDETYRPSPRRFGRNGMES